MSRRLTPFMTLLAMLAVVACNAAPVAPPLTDPKEILVKSLTALQGAKTIQLKGTFGGTVTAPQMGNFDLSTVKLEVAVDVAGKKTKLNVDAPSLMGTNVELIALPDAIYVKMLGAASMLLGLDSTGKYTQLPAPTSGPEQDATDPLKALAELQKQLDELPTPPRKLGDEKCGDTDCYHVQLPITADDLKGLASGAPVPAGSGSLDVWSRKNDLRPAKLGFSVDAGEQGTVTGTFDVTYDQGVDISAPPADQVVQAP
jgi:hypothetical protein